MGGHMLDLSKRGLHDDAGNDVPVTAGEFDLLKLFAENPNRPLSRDWLLETTSHRERDPFDRAIDLRITRIRRKIEPAARQADGDSHGARRRLYVRAARRMSV